MLKDSIIQHSRHNVLSQNEKIIKNDSMVIAVVEPILFGIYGKENIVKQKPYSAIEKDGIWFVYGTLPSSGIDEKSGIITLVCGGVFEIVVDAYNSEVIK